MKFVADEKAFKELTEDPKGMVGRYLTRLGQRLQFLARRQVGVDTGALRRSISYKLAHNGRGLVMTVGSNNKIALLHHEGTVPHTILPRKAKTLRFYSRGRIVYAKIVRHPGTNPNRYLTDNLRKIMR